MSQMAPVIERGDRVPQGAAIAPPAPGMSGSAGNPDDNDLMCEHAPAGTVVEVPAPFNQWLVLVCSPIGQALVPVKGASWVAHGTLDPISILAQPPTASVIPPSDEFDPRYGLRFKTLIGIKAQDERHKRALAMLKLASGADPVPTVEEIWQLDAVSNIVDTRYNIFFYTRKEKPQRIIACLDQCQQALLLDVVPSVKVSEATPGLRP
ncbi:MAG: hypothetical protein WBN97_10395 [Parvibaculum sp.]